MEGQTNGQKTDKRTVGITPIVMMVIYLPVKFEFDWSNRFRVKSPETEMLMNRQMDKKHTNKQTELHQFQKEPSYDGDLCDLSLNSIGQTVFKLESGNKNVDGQMDGQTNRQNTDKRTDGITPISKGS